MDLINSKNMKNFFLLLFLAVVLGCSSNSETKLELAIAKSLEIQETQKCITSVDFTDLFSFEWDCFYVFYPNASAKTIIDRTKTVDKSKVEKIPDKNFALVFVSKGNVTKILHLPTYQYNIIGDSINYKNNCSFYVDRISSGYYLVNKNLCGDCLVIDKLVNRGYSFCQ